MKQLSKKLSYRFLLTIVAISVSWTLFAQQSGRTATGVVVDESGEPIIGVNVITKEAPLRGATTDLDGRFTLQNIREGETLEFKFVGMNVVEVIFNGEPIHVVMHENAFSMDEVLVVAYGEQRRSAFTGSATVVTSEAISRRPVSNVMSALEGMTSGIQIQSTSGAPGSTPAFRIRGASSISAGRDPLVVLDGVPYESGWNNINPSDIESVTVLKDAASTAIYGARGGNGVILVTTKKANRGENTVVTFDSKFAITKLRQGDLYDVISSPGEYYEQHYNALYNYFSNVAGYNTYRANQEANASWLKNSDEGGLGYMVYTVPNGQQLIGYNGRLNPSATLGRVVVDSKGNSYYQQPDDWVNETFKTGFRQDYNISARGGSDKLTLLATAGYTKEDGITNASGYERFTGRLKGTFSANNWLRLSANIDISVAESDNSLDYSNNSNNMFSNATRVAPIYPIYIRDIDKNIMYDENGKVYDYGDGTYNDGISRPINTGSNRIQEASLQTRREASVKTGAQGAADITILPNLTASLNAAFEERDRRYKTTGQPFYGTSYPGGSISVYSYKNQSINLQQLINYSKRLGSHNIKATLLHEWYKYNYYYLFANKSNMFSYFQNQELAGAITLNDANSYGREYQSEGFGGRVLYDYKGIYHFDASYRRDASTRFAPQNSWGNFFSFGGAYLISRENFFRVSWIDELKLKFSVGQNGNDQIGSSYNRYEDAYEIQNSNGEIALTFSSRGNENITWETRTAINTGIEFELFKGRLRSSVEYYNNRTTNMLASVSVPYSLGYSSYWANVGSMRNSGFELELYGDIIRSKNFKWTMYLNASTNKSKILSLAEERTGETLFDMNGNAVAKGYSSGNYFYGEGLEFRTWRMRKFAGTDNSGRATWYVLDEATGDISTTTTYSSASYFASGSSQPKLIGGFGGSLSWKSLEFSYAFSYRLGGQGYDSGYSTLMTAPYNGRTGYNYHVDVKNSWTPQNNSNEFARWQYDDRYFASSSDRWLTKADYLTLQNISLGYSVPQKYVQKMGISGLVVSMGVDNLFILSHRKGFIPSRDFDGNINFGYYPETSRYMLNVSFRF